MADGPFSAVVVFPTTELVESVVMTAGGPPGPAGEAADISIGNTTTGVAGTFAAVTNTGTSTHAVFEFTIPRGAQGETGYGVPLGGLVGQTIAKIDSADGNTEWVSIPSANTVSARVVSVSAELASLIASGDNALSARITSAEAAAGTSVTSAKVQIASAAATSANAHANTVSARVVSVSAELASLLASGDNALSVRVTSADTHAETASAAAASVNAHAAAASAAATSADAHANTVSARAVSISNELGSLLVSASAALESHVNAVSARVVSTSAELASLMASADAALSTRIDTISVPASSVTSAKVATASAAATSADAHANTVSQRVVSVSAELGSVIASGDAFLSARITSAEALTGAGTVTHAGGALTDNAVVLGASAADTKVVPGITTDGANVLNLGQSGAALGQIQFFNTISGNLFLRPVSSALGTNNVINIPTEANGTLALQSYVNASVQTASAAATSADTHANTVSARVVSASAELASLVQVASAAATSADGHANTVSARAASISAELSSVIASGDAFLSARITSAEALVGGGGSVTSAEVYSIVQGYSTVATAAGTTAVVAGTPPQIFFTGSTTQTVTLPNVTTLVLGKQYVVCNDSTGVVTVQSSGGNTIVALAGGSSAVFICIAITGTGTASWSFRYSNTATDIVSAQLVSVSAILEAHAATASAAATSADGHANTVSARAVSISAELASLVQVASAAATSADGHANTVSARVVSVSAELMSQIASGDAFLSNRITSAEGVGGGGSVTSNEVSVLVQVASAAATSADAHANTASAAATSADAHANTVSARAVSISAELVSLVQIASAAATSADGHANTASAAATSADGHANTVSVRAVSISNELGSLLASASAALQVNINAVSNATSNETSARQSASAAIETHVNTLSARVVSVSAELASMIQGYSTIATAAGTTAVVAATPPELFFTGVTTQTVTLPDVTTLVLGKQYLINNDSSGVVTVQSSGANTIVAMGASTAAVFTVIAITGTGTGSWSYRYSNTGTDVVSAQLVSVSAALTSAFGASVSVLSNRVTSVSNELGSLLNVSVSVLSNRVTSVSNELGSLIASQTARRAVNTAAQASITVSVGSTVSGVSIALVGGQTYHFEFFIPFVANSPAGIVVGVVSPATTTFAAQYTIPSSVAATGVLPAAANMISFASPTTNTKYSTVSITLTGVTLNVGCIGTINPSGSGSLKFLIGPGTTNTANNGLVVQVGANLRVWREA